jgi:hypothetical protein
MSVRCSNLWGKDACLILLTNQLTFYSTIGTILFGLMVTGILDTVGLKEAYDLLKNTSHSSLAHSFPFGSLSLESKSVFYSAL